MLFNLNEFLMAVSFTLDFVEMDIIGVTSNHGKRTAYISLRMARELGLEEKELHDTVALAMLHDNGVSEKSLHDRYFEVDSINPKSLERIKEHCTVGEVNVSHYPFLTEVKDVIKYHHENFNGTGFFNLESSEIPLISQIIHLADVLETTFHLENSDLDLQNRAVQFVKEQRSEMFSSRLVDAFTHLAMDQEFWANIKDESIYKALKDETPQLLSFANG